MSAEKGRYVYHYCAVVGNNQYAGISLQTSRITSWDDQQKFIAELSSQSGLDLKILTSLSYLGRELGDGE